MAAGGTRYHGGPCGRCGGTERLVSNRQCVVCEAARQRERWHSISGYEYNRRLLQMRRVKALRRMAARAGR